MTLAGLIVVVIYAWVGLVFAVFRMIDLPAVPVGQLVKGVLVWLPALFWPPIQRWMLK